MLESCYLGRFWGCSLYALDWWLDRCAEGREGGDGGDGVVVAGAGGGKEMFDVRMMRNAEIVFHARSRMYGMVLSRVKYIWVSSFIQQLPIVKGNS